MKKKTKFGLAITLAGAIIGCLGLGSANNSAEAQVTYQPPYISYAAKFVCGPMSNDTTTTGSTLDVVKGMYTTAINIHNPYLKDVIFYKKAVIADAERRHNNGIISNIVQEPLGPDGARYVDCTDIRSLFPAGTNIPKHIEGFLVIIVPIDATGRVTELDVIGKYTARHRNSAGGVSDVNTDVESIDIEKVWPTHVNQ